MLALLFVVIVVGTVSVFVWLTLRKTRDQVAQEAFIRHGVLPLGLFERLRHKHPHLTLKDCQLVANGLRQFFLVYHHSGFKFVAMPSQVVDDLWHEFILFTRDYDAFCQQAFGHFLHHTPSVALSGNQNSNDGLRRCWQLACKEENIHPRVPSRLPLLFALDKKLGIPNGFVYEVDCSGLKRKDDNGGASPYCGGDLSSDSGGSGDSGGADGSDGGSSCGGGCGGGD
jgi:hypothetical protein